MAATGGTIIKEHSNKLGSMYLVDILGVSTERKCMVMMIPTDSFHFNGSGVGWVSKWQHRPDIIHVRSSLRLSPLCCNIAIPIFSEYNQDSTHHS